MSDPNPAPADTAPDVARDVAPDPASRSGSPEPGPVPGTPVGGAQDEEIEIAPDGPLAGPRFRFCPQCGGANALRTPDDDNRPRDVCLSCGAIHYHNPRIVVGVVCTWEDRILLCRRAIEPRHGLWTLPAGFHEIGESTETGALRETLEESGADVELDAFYSKIDVLPAEQVHIFYRGRMRSPRLDPGPESLEALLFREEDIPWDQIAFRTVKMTLRWFIDDRRRGNFGFHADVLG